MMHLQDPPPDPTAGTGTRPPRRPPRPAAAARLPPQSPAVAVSALLEAHGAEIYRHLRRLSPAADDAADLHQETFLRAFRAFPSLPADANHRAWLHRIAANTAADAHRRRAVRAAAHAGAGPGIGRRVAGPGPARDPSVGGAGTQASSPSVLAEAEPSRDPAVDPVARAEAAELRSAVRAALAGLPWRERTAVVARVLDGRDYADVAEALACSEVNARQLVSRGVRRVRAALAPYLEIDR